MFYHSGKIAMQLCSYVVTDYFACPLSLHQRYADADYADTNPNRYSNANKSN